MKNDNAPILIVNNLSKSYRTDGVEVPVFQDISFSVNAGEVIAIMGPSGIGKSTLLNLVGTLDYPDSGEISYQGINPFSLADREIARFRNKTVGFVFQFHHLLPEFTALENVMIPSIIYQYNPNTAKESAKEILDQVGLGHRIHHRPSALSGGERQRVAVARALINKPLVVLADEPSGNLDSYNSDLLIELILKLNEQDRRTFIIATHNSSIASKSHRVLLLDNGGACFK
ncbi:MAG: ABC transporter ATP-binding protein [Candidatus Marinimicrobia bacterium]|nr:ABC transporter ATP-binding protein [Candidatus Neomarinimicrobiota bacterium]